MRDLLSFEPCPSATRISPVDRTARPVGWLKVSLPMPLSPALPSFNSTLPSGENLTTCWPLPSLVWKSAAQTLPSLSTAMPWALANSPAPKFLIVLPSGPRWKMGEAFDLEQPSSPQRSKTQTLSLESTVTALVGAQGRGVCAQL